MRYTQEQITSWINDYKSSGQSIAEYSKNKPFHSSSLSFWMSKRKDTNSFIEIKPSIRSNSSIEIRRPDGLIITVSKPLSIAELVQLIKC